MTYKSHRSGPDRVFDHLYDPLFITSGAKDIWKENHNALCRSAPVHIYPQYGTMFSDLPRCARNYYIQQRNPLPHFPSIGDENLDGKNQKAKREAVICGRDRAKFFNIPLNNEVTMNFKLDIKDGHTSYRSTSKTPKQGFRTVGCETIYREQSAQTKPWMPDFKLDGSTTETPEVIYAANLIEGDGTPGMLDVQRIERARRRRQWEKSQMEMSQSKSVYDWNERKMVLEALEFEEYLARENEIDQCQKIRFGMVERMLNSRESKMLKDFDNQSEHTAKRLLREKEKKLNNLRINHQRTLRRLDKRFGRKSKNRNASAVDQRSGHQVKHMSYNTDFEARLDGLHNLQTKLTNLERFIQPKIDITKPKLPSKEVKKGFWTEKYLRELYESLKVMKGKAIQQRVANCLVDIRDEVLSYVSTANPSLDSYTFELEYQHSVFIQRLIKGRAIQSIVHEGKDAYQELINELKETFELDTIWKAKSYEDWNEDTLMEFLMEYLDKEFIRYDEEKKTRKLLEEQRRRRKEDEQKMVKNNVSGCLEDLVTDCVETMIKTDDNIPNKSDDSDVVFDVLNTLVLPEIFDKLSSSKEQDKNDYDDNNKRQDDRSLASDAVDCNLIVKDTIDHLIENVIPHPMQNVADTIIDQIVKKVVFADEVYGSLHEDSSENSEDMGSMATGLCNRLWTFIDKNAVDEPIDPYDDDNDDEK